MSHAHNSDPNRAFAHEECLLTRRLLRKLVPVSDMTIWRWERDGRFPRHLAVHGRNYWLLSEVRTWLATQERGRAPFTREAGP